MLAAGTRAEVRFANVDVLRPAFSRLLGDPPMIRMDVVPDTFEGGYARVSVYSQHAAIGGMRVDEMWIRLIGASFDPDELRRGTLKVLGVRDSGMYARLGVHSIEAFLSEQGTIGQAQLTQEQDLVVATGILLYNGVPTRVQIKGLFQVYGEPEIRFHIQTLSVEGLPMPYAVVDRLERQVNPVVDFRSWPVPFKVRSFRAVPGGFILSSQRDFAQPCNDCGGPELRLTP